MCAHVSNFNSFASSSSSFLVFVWLCSVYVCAEYVCNVGCFGLVDHFTDSIFGVHLANFFSLFAVAVAAAARCLYRAVAVG